MSNKSTWSKEPHLRELAYEYIRRVQDPANERVITDLLYSIPICSLLVINGYYNDALRVAKTAIQTARHIV